MITKLILLLTAVFCILIGLVMAKDEHQDQYYEDKNN